MFYLFADVDFRKVVSAKMQWLPVLAFYHRKALSTVLGLVKLCGLFKGADNAHLGTEAKVPAICKL